MREYWKHKDKQTGEWVINGHINGVRRRKFFLSKELAEKFETAAKSEIFHKRYDLPLDMKVKVVGLIERFLREYSIKKSMHVVWGQDHVL